MKSYHWMILLSIFLSVTLLFSPADKLSQIKQKNIAKNASRNNGVSHKHEIKPKAYVLDDSTSKRSLASLSKKKFVKRPYSKSEVSYYRKSRSNEDKIILHRFRVLKNLTARPITDELMKQYPSAIKKFNYLIIPSDEIESDKSSLVVWDNEYNQFSLLTKVLKVQTSDFNKLLSLGAIRVAKLVEEYDHIGVYLFRFDQLVELMGSFHELKRQGFIDKVEVEILSFEKVGH